MATLVTKNSSTAAAVPGTGDLVQGELAVNVTDKRLFTKNAGGSVVEVGTNPSTIENNLLIGTTTNASGRRLLVNGTGSGATYAAVGDSSQTANQVVLGIEPAASLSWLNSTSWSLAFGANGTERARITSGGDFLVGTANASATTGVGVKTISSGSVYAVGATSDYFSGYNSSAGAFRFYVSIAGTISATNTTISAISDQRLKENIRDIDVGLDKIMALKPRKFDWKAGKGQDKKDVRGFIAQEFEQVFPDLIDEWKDPAPEGEEPYKAVRADLIPVLVKAIQEQQALITDLRARVAALEAA